MNALVGDETAINQLPNEMLTKVFEKLDSESLKNCLQVNQKWNSLIGQNVSLMKQLPLGLEGPQWRRILQHTIEFNRKYHTINIENSDWNINSLKVLRKHGAESRLIRFTECEFKNPSEVISKILDSFEKVEKISFQYCNIKYSFAKRLKRATPKDLPRLKSVVMSSSSLLILDLFKMSQLKSLKMRSGNHEEGEETLMKFLGTQKELEDLALSKVCQDFGIFEISDINAVNLPLKRLSLKFDSSHDNGENLVVFISRFAGTLEELELSGLFERSVYEMIFEKLHKLKVVDIKVDGIPEEDVCYHNLRPNYSIRKLIVRGNIPEFEAALEKFIGNMPNIETLVLNTNVGGDEISRDFMLFVSNNLQGLKNLHVELASGEMFSGVQLTSLKTLSFSKVDTLAANDWKRIVAAMTNIETLSLATIYDETSLNSRMSNIFTKGWKKLTHVKLGQGFVAVKQIFTQLLRNCAQIETVEVNESAFAKDALKKTAILRAFKKDGLRFIIHEDGEIQKIFHEGENGLWLNEDVESDEPDEDSEDSEAETDDDDSLFDLFGLGALALRARRLV